jgi:hypothetical protein
MWLVANIITAEPGFEPTFGNVRFVMDKVAIGKDFSEYFGFPRKILIPPNASYSCINRGWYKQTQSQLRTRYKKKSYKGFRYPEIFFHAAVYTRDKSGTQYETADSQSGYGGRLPSNKIKQE